MVRKHIDIIFLSFPSNYCIIHYFLVFSMANYHDSDTFMIQNQSIISETCINDIIIHRYDYLDHNHHLQSLFIPFHILSIFFSLYYSHASYLSIRRKSIFKTYQCMLSTQILCFFSFVHCVFLPLFSMIPLLVCLSCLLCRALILPSRPSIASTASPIRWYLMWCS